MSTIQGTILLFTLNLLDALLTLIWIRNGLATEGNHLMAKLLEIGDGTFLTVKIGIGLFAATVLFKFGYMKLAKYGLSLALVVYVGIMGIHLITGLSALGYVSNDLIQDVTSWTQNVFALFL